MKYPIKGFQLASLIEREGCVTSVVYLAGCNFRCGFCHNQDLLCNKEEMETIALCEILDAIEGQRGWIDAVAITGGEPTCCLELPKLIKEFKKSGLQVQIHTNGSNPLLIKSLVNQGLLDYIAMDFKAPFNESYQKITRAHFDLSLIKESIDFLFKGFVEYELRTTLIPSFHTQEVLIDMAKTVSQAKRYFLQNFSNQFVNDQVFSKISPYTLEEIKKLAKKMSFYCPSIQLRGFPSFD